MQNTFKAYLAIFLIFAVFNELSTMTTTELNNKLVELWGSAIKPISVLPTARLSDNINFTQLSTDNLVTLLDILGKASGSNRSGFFVDWDNYDILNVIRQKLQNSSYQSRRVNPVRRCYDILFYDHSIEGLFALASMYLVAELEYLLKKAAKYLDIDGTIIKELPRSLRTKLSTNNYRVGKRVNQIGDVIKIYCYRNESRFAQYLKSYDKQTKKFMKIRLIGRFNTVDGKKIKIKYVHTSLITRINTSRNQIMHGEKSYVTGEIFFFLTLHSIYYLLNDQIYKDY